MPEQTRFVRAMLQDRLLQDGLLPADRYKDPLFEKRGFKKKLVQKKTASKHCFKTCQTLLRPI
jgi:hypothetical protein